jgi:hypothetical protein
MASRSGDTVQGGTNAGWKKPLVGRRDPWQCPNTECGRINQGFIVRCLGPGCNEARPK